MPDEIQGAGREHHAEGMTVRSALAAAALATVLLLAAACSDGDGGGDGTVTPTTAAPPTVTATATAAPTASPVSDPFASFSDNVEVTFEGDLVVLRSDGVPGHVSPYFDPSDPRYDAYDGDNPQFQQNPNRIAAQTLVLRIPRNPQPADQHQATPLGPIGIAVNGVALFNQYAGPDQPLANEINSFDQCDAHPEERGLYHYHLVPDCLIEQVGADGLVGFLIDGFPVYGPQENGAAITNADLDAYHGHSHATPEYPDGIYHYHVTDEAPYMNGDGFYGVPGTVER